MEQLNLGTVAGHTVGKKIISGLTEGKSCLNNSINFSDEKTFLVDEWRAMDIVYLNFCKALESVSHNILLYLVVCN